MTEKRILLWGRQAGKATFLKAHVDQFTRKDGSVVAAHDTKVQAKGYDHPNVIGHAEKLQGGDASKAHGMHYAGKEYSYSGKDGKSMHDGTPVRHFREQTGSGDDDGQHVWMDHGGRVHADDTTQVAKQRATYEAHAAKSAPKAKPAGWREAHDQAQEHSHAAWNGGGVSHTEASASLKHAARRHTAAAASAKDMGEDGAQSFHAGKAKESLALAAKHDAAGRA